MGTWIVGTVLLVIVGSAVYKVIMNRKRGRGCGCGCDGCSGCPGGTEDK